MNIYKIKFNLLINFYKQILNVTKYFNKKSINIKNVLKILNKLIQVKFKTPYFISSTSFSNYNKKLFFNKYDEVDNNFFIISGLHSFSINNAVFLDHILSFDNKINYESLNKKLKSLHKTYNFLQKIFIPYLLFVNKKQDFYFSEMITLNEFLINYFSIENLSSDSIKNPFIFNFHYSEVNYFNLVFIYPFTYETLSFFLTSEYRPFGILNTIILKSMMIKLDEIFYEEIYSKILNEI